MASRFSKLTSVLVTPSTLVSARFTVIGQAAQVMPGTDSVTVCVPAHAGPAISVAIANTANSLFMASSRSVEQRKDVRKGECNQHQRRHDPEDDLVGDTHLGDRTDLAGLARRCRTEYAPPSKEQRQEPRADENRAI